MSLLQDFHFALGFLTRLPLPAIRYGVDVNLKRAVWSFPLVGLVIGGLAAAMLWLLAALAVPLALQVLLGLLAGVLLSGALHEDGLADFADGLGVTGRRRVIEVMRDSQIGTYGVLALIFSLLWRGFALYELMRAGFGPSAFIFMYVAGRGALAPLFSLPLADQAGVAHQMMGKAPVGLSSGRALLAAQLGCLLFSLLILFLLAGWLAALLGLGLALGAAFAVGMIARARIGGMTGDIFGACEQAGEIVAVGALLALVV